MNNCKKYKIKILVSWILVIIWAGIIFYLSSKTAVESTVQSRGVINTFSGFLGVIVPNEESLIVLDGIVRESAHGVEYFILGALLYNAFIVCLNYRKQEELLLTAETGIECTDKFRELNCIICSLLISCIYALSDEIHQIPIPGRAFQLMDLGIDFLGSLVGILVVFLFYKLRKKHISKK